ncbi:MAG: phosphoribosyltransferase family protein [Gemmatimonadota bacterium]|nr:phosphoribosyltransferase family protein [Gemmatimonadota bacterium]
MLILTRTDAGRRLAAGLGPLLVEPPVILALSANGAQVAGEIAAAFRAPLDIMAVRRLEVPGRAHAIFGAVADGTTILDEDRVRELGLPEEYVRGLVAAASADTAHCAAAWREGADPINLAGRTVVLVDDGQCEVLAVTAAARALATCGASRVLFVAPTGSRMLAARMAALGIETLFLIEPGAPFGALVRDANFAQTTPHEVGTLVRRSRPDLTGVKGP